jgi:hypothetical protein
MPVEELVSEFLYGSRLKYWKKGFDMNEIKSTLDIIMEKAKAFEVTDEEKEAFQKEDLEKRARGLLQRYLDGHIRLGALKSKLESRGDEHLDTVQKAMIQTCMERIDPDGDNSALLDALREVGEVDVGPLMDLLQTFREDYGSQKQRYEKAFKKRLEKRGVFGSAVIPNIQGIPEWQETVAALKEGFQDKKDVLHKEWLGTA